MDKQLVEPRNISMYPEHWAVLHQICKEISLASVSAANRYVITDWQRLKQRELEGNGRLMRVVAGYLAKTITAEEAMEAIAGSPEMLGE